MFLLRSEKELIDSFFPRHQKRLELPNGLKFPLVVRDYFAWVDSSNLKVNLVFSEPGVNKPIGIIFDRHSGAGGTAAICEWCHSYGSSNQIGLLSIDVSSKRRVGVHLCLDLGCREKIEADLGLSPMAAQARARRVVDEMSRFVRRMLL